MRGATSFLLYKAVMKAKLYLLFLSVLVQFSLMSKITAVVDAGSGFF